MRGICIILVLFTAVQARAQYPLVRSLEVRTGQQRPSLTRVVQDHQGLLWVVGNGELLRTDGELVEVMLRTEADKVVAITPAHTGVVVATANGGVLHCAQGRCDTILLDSNLRVAPIRGLAVAKDGSIWLGTYGKGLAHVRGASISFVDMGDGLPDDHVNDLDLLPDGRVVVATDQGLAIVKGEQVLSKLGEAEGAPDNLTLCVDVSDKGEVWAGTDRSGVFRWRPERDTVEVEVLNVNWPFGPVRRVRASGDMVWAGTEATGPIAIDRTLRQGTYRSRAAFGKVVRDLMVDRDGAVWWCDDTELLHRADPAMLFVPEHEGLDLGHITALCTDESDRIWFATPDGLFQHVAWFSEERTVTRIPLPIDPHTPIVSLATDKDGTVWAATFGEGVIAILANGTANRYTTKEGLSNDNVLSVRRGSNGMWFATLDGITRYDGQRFTAMAPEAGFVFDVAERDGRVLMATDGRGVVELRTGGAQALPVKGGTFYTLADGGADLWAAGPSTGFCRIGPGVPLCVGADKPPFDGDVYAMGYCAGWSIAFGSTGVLAFDARTGALNDVTAAFGLVDITAELNVAVTDRSGALWFGCSKGLVRLRPTKAHFQGVVAAIIQSASLGPEEIVLGGEIEVPHDHNSLHVKFTGLHYADPSAVRFEYRLLGLNDLPVRTRDRAVSFAALRPGTYTFQVRAFVGDEPGPAQWKEFQFTVHKPWWRTGWAIAGGVLLVSIIIFFVVRTRERRIRYRDRMEKENVRFQLDALRSQVDPHFLFNSFNALVELIETNPQLAVGHVEQLSTFFRDILQVREHERITVRAELQLLSNYFALEQRRFGASIQLDVQLEEKVMARGIVPLTLQLLVENALKHNVITSDRVFRVTVREANDELVVSNTLRPRLTPPRSTGFGLDSINKRYSALTARPVVVERKPTEFSVRIPLIDIEP